MGVNVLLVCPLSTLTADTDGKYLLLGSLLQREGFTVTVCCWSEEVEAVCKQLSLPYLHLALGAVPVNLVEEGKAFVSLLGDRKVIDHPQAPTWGSLLGFDDFIGVAQKYTVEGADSQAPDVVLMPQAGGDGSTQEDEQARVVLWRWTRKNQIPLLMLEVQSLDSRFTLQQVPPDLLLRWKGGDYQTSFPLHPLYRYLCSHGHEASFDQALQEEVDLRKSLGWTPGTYYCYLPLHLYYLTEIIQILQEVQGVWEEMQEAGFQLLFSCGKAHRRGLSEKEIIEQALKPWLPFPYLIVENGSIPKLALLSAVTLLPYPHGVRSLLDSYGVLVLGRGEVGKVKGLRLPVRPQEAIMYLLDRRKYEKQ